MTKPGFRLKGKRFHLIYARCDASPEELFQFLSGLDRPILRCRIGKETHSDGGAHRHVAVEFRSPYDKRNADRYFDYNNHHPQILPKRTKAEWNATWNYAGKDGDDTVYGEPYDAAQEKEEQPLLSDLARSCTSYLHFLDEVDRRGAQFGLAREIWTTVNNGSSNITITDENADTFSGGTISSGFLRDLLFDPTDIRSLILQGPTQIGKSTWAIKNMPRPCLWATHTDDLVTFRPGYHVSIIFDDMNFQHLPRQSQLHLADNRQARSIHCRYVRARLPRGLHKVFTCNEGDSCFPFKTYLENGMPDDAILSRINVVVCSSV